MAALLMPRTVFRRVAMRAMQDNGLEAWVWNKFDAQWESSYAELSRYASARQAFQASDPLGKLRPHRPAR
jgi:hypothetical protein